MKIVGILNITHNSFSDGGLYLDTIEAMKRLEHLFASGANIVDIGGTSTAYGAQLLDHDEEWSKLGAALTSYRNVYGTNRLPDISIDTFHWKSAQKAIDFGVGYINDVSFGRDSNMLDLIAQHKHVKYVLMYSLVLPADKSVRVKKVQEIEEKFEEKLDECIKRGISLDQIIIDPGIGFATNASQSFEVLRNIRLFKKFGTEVLVGHSRKSFLEMITDLPPIERDLETVVASLYLLDNNVDYVRVHNVEWHNRAFATMQELRKQ
ncbi:dihydropteroate synthase [Rickettsiales endosymbiont of Peranema trichophorum]|uniref:dihydropteroate synthase n=1 Tax=Rickettsiales endosymbiont of Peranema trichophorum TaxID=2486577 RepID=UPI001023137A|nr:dihydropteroate synthase [Rickettsiales endosymbiont of Peranema trichophorum]RZI46330.1 dihydropteroate synthase [Rickettsiales endosymbiont of Peranema trichophorum]